MSSSVPAAAFTSATHGCAAAVRSAVRRSTMQCSVAGPSAHRELFLFGSRCGALHVDGSLQAAAAVNECLFLTPTLTWYASNYGLQARWAIRPRPLECAPGLGHACWHPLSLPSSLPLPPDPSAPPLNSHGTRSSRMPSRSARRNAYSTSPPCSVALRTSWPCSPPDAVGPLRST